MKKKALITGITGQDGAYLAQYLLKQDYDLVGTSRILSSKNRWRLKYLHVDKKLKIYNSSIINTNKIYSFLKKNMFDEIYNLSGISSVQKSFLSPISTFKANTFDCLQILNAIHVLKLKTRFYQASSSEMFGNSKLPCTEKIPFKPLSPYAISKLSAHQITVNYRNNYGIFASNGILFNHESPLRGKDFVSKKIIETLVLIKKGSKKTLKIGNIYAKRDWGHASDYVRGMHLILSHHKADDFILTSEQNFSVKDMINLVCKILDINGKWKGRGNNEYYEYDKRKIVIVDKQLFRPLDIMTTKGSSKKARNQLSWIAEYKFRDLIVDMIKYEYSQIK